MTSLLIRNGIILTMNDRMEVVQGDVLVRDGRIAAVGDVGAPREADGSPAAVIDARGGFVLPGFIQTHVHLCQTLFRGYADDMPLLEWLRRRIWPMEAAHTPDTLRASVRAAAAELLLSGTTGVLTMETVHDTDVVFEALDAIGMRATVGKCMMDADRQVPARLLERTRDSIDESLALMHRWHGAGDGRLRAAFAPRFALSCSRDLLESVAALSRERGHLVHTHAAEQRDEVALVRESTGLTNIQYLAQTGLASHRLCAAHCVWLEEEDYRVLAEQHVNVLHCPGSNLKLGSGLAPIAELHRRGVAVSLGADGAACNNQLDMFNEMRLAATLQAVRERPGALAAADVLWMATRNGARALGLEAEAGSIEPGKRADLIVIDRDRPHLAGAPDPYSAIVYAARGADVRATVVNGRALVADFRLTELDRSEIAAEAAAAGRALASRAGV